MAGRMSWEVDEGCEVVVVVVVVVSVKELLVTALCLFSPRLLFCFKVRELGGSCSLCWREWIGGRWVEL